MLRCGIYLRVSSEEQDSPGKSSIETQRQDCTALAAQLGWVIAGEYLDSRRFRVGNRWFEPSGTRTERPAWRRLLADLEAGRIQAVVGWHSSRLYRGYRPAVDFLEVVEKHDVEVRLVKDSWDRKFAMIQAWVAKEENTARVERTRFGQAARARKGMTATKTTPYYKPIREPDTGEVLGYEFDERYRGAFERMATLFLQRVSYRYIHRELGINPRTGRRWGPETIRTILNNPYYRGWIEYGRRARTKSLQPFRVQGVHKPVWDEATCQAIEIEAARRREVGHHGPRAKLAPFAGILRCGICGHLMTPSAKRRNGPTRRGRAVYRSYDCYRSRQVRRGVYEGNGHAANSIVEIHLLDQLREVLASVERGQVEQLVKALAASLPKQPVDDAYIREQLVEVESQISTLEDELGMVRSAPGRAALAAERDRLAELAQSYRDSLVRLLPATTVDQARSHDALLRLVDQPDLLDLPDEDLRPLLRFAFPVLYVTKGRLALPPQ